MTRRENQRKNFKNVFKTNNIPFYAKSRAHEIAEKSHLVAREAAWGFHQLWCR